MWMLSLTSGWDGEIWLSGFAPQALNKIILSNPIK